MFRTNYHQVSYILIYRKRNSQLARQRIVHENSEERMMVDNAESFIDSEDEIIDVTDQNENLNENVTKTYNFSKRKKRFTENRRNRRYAKKRKEKQYSTPEGLQKNQENDRKAKVEIRSTDHGNTKKAKEN